ncbi:uncharacterized protein LOC134264555 [Saccostrea cucullata]|uniref:uncharacterized protein LOC134264555 n=1 Tax=Saccostrea cuccullata TaxID=36930 RepID=UPI002ED1A5A0
MYISTHSFLFLVWHWDCICSDLLQENRIMRQTEEMDLLLPNLKQILTGILVTAIAGGLFYMLCRKCKTGSKEVKILSIHDDADKLPDHLECLKSLIKREIKRKVEWEKKIKKGRKYLLPCNISSRVSHDVHHAFKQLNLQVTEKGLEKQILLVPMHRTESEKPHITETKIGADDSDLNKFKRVDIMYKGRYTVVNGTRLVGEGIKNFLANR